MFTIYPFFYLPGQKHGQPLSSHWDHRREGFVLGMAVALMVFILFQWMKNRKTQGKKSRGLRNTCLGLIFLCAVVGGLFYTGKLPQELSGMMPCDDADSCLPVVSAAVTILISTYSFIRVVRVPENPGIKTEVAVPSWFLPTGMGFGVGLFVGIGSICLYFIMKSKQGLPENIAAYLQFKRLTDYFENFRGIQSGEGVPSWLLPAGMGFAVSLVFTAVSSLLVCLCCLGKTQRVKENQMGQKTEVNDTGNEHQTHHQVDETDLTLKTDVKKKQMGQKDQVNDTAKKDQKGQEFQTTPKRHKRHNMDEVDNTEQKKKIAALEQWNKELRDEISRANLVIENLKEKQEELCFHQIQRFEGFPGLFQIKHLEDFLHVHIFEVIMTLDEDTMNPYLRVSEDGRELRWTEQRQNLPDNPERFDEYPCMLGNRLPAEMRWGCYWEVEVGNKKSWELGVARDSVCRKGQLSLSPGAGFWVLSLWDEKLTALTDPETSLNTEVPRRVGIYVNYKEKKVHFYNADVAKDSNKSEKYTLIHTFREEIDRTVRPFFSPGNSDLDPLIITQDH
uniref:B30.2/SPRY domain-containing protein n=1 Tax=Lepisosteus oculatus TaxID=7918 RepID=W5M270_LEPOC